MHYFRNDRRLEIREGDLICTEEFCLSLPVNRLQDHEHEVVSVGQTSCLTKYQGRSGVLYASDEFWSHVRPPRLGHPISGSATCVMARRTERYLWVVLADRGENFKERWVTWQYNGENPGCFWGHYFTKYEDAMRDYLDR